MNFGIEGKVALVTACSSGLANAVAHALAAEGVNLLMFARSEDKLRASAAEIEKKYQVRAVTAVGDMRDKGDVDSLLETLKREFGGLDILILSTGRPPVPMREVLEEDEEQRWEEAYRTQLWGAVLVARKTVPLMLERGWGRVIGITSASVKQPMPKHGLSTVFRAGLTGYLKHLANEIATQGVTVNTVCPASIDTASLRGSYELAERLKRVPMGRLGTTEEFASTVAYLASRQAGFITGASLQVDGGMTASLY